MKKITLLSILTFIIIVGVIFIGGTISGKNEFARQYSSQKFQIANTQNNNKLNNSSVKNRLNSPDINIANFKFNLESSSPDTFTLDEVSKHDTKNDCYLIINNKVYDVSSYIGYHPGGSKIIISRCGKEVTGIFARIHSNRAWDLLKRYKIGTITTSKPNITPKVLSAISKALKDSNPTAEIIKVSPKSDFYIAKLIFNGKFYEIHINNSGQIIKEEIGSDELNWSIWENDNDDR